MIQFVQNQADLHNDISRKIDKEFECFHENGRKEALLIDGARQVGKTFSIREYGKRHFEHVVDIF